MAHGCLQAAAEAAVALAELVRSNHSNQEAAADEGALDVVLARLGATLVPPLSRADTATLIANGVGGGGVGADGGRAEEAAAGAEGLPAGCGALLWGLFTLLGALSEFNSMNRDFVRWVGGRQC